MMSRRIGQGGPEVGVLSLAHAAKPAAFFGMYVEVTPYSRLAWTNEEGGEGGPAAP